MADKSDVSEIKLNPIVRPNWKIWKKKSAWRLSDAVALSLNISPSFIDKIKKSHPAKYKTYVARLGVVEGQKPGTFEFFDKHLGNGATHNSTMVSPQSFVSFAMSENGWKKLPHGFLAIGQVNESPSADISIKVYRKGNVKFIPALIKLLVEIGYREGKNGNPLSVDSMPGIRSDFFIIARRYDKNLSVKSIDTFETYIKGLCKFGKGSRTSTFYTDLFPDYPPKLGNLGEGEVDSSIS